jgi:hypothetical protein
MGDWTLIYEDFDSDMTPGGVFDKSMVDVSKRSGELTLALTVAPQTWVWVSPQGSPYSTNWRESETATVKVRITTANANGAIGGVALRRYDGDGNDLLLYATSGVINEPTTAGVKTFNLTTQGDGGTAWALTDRLALTLTMAANPAGNVGIGFGTIDDSLTVPIERTLDVNFGIWSEPIVMRTA